MNPAISWAQVLLTLGVTAIIQIVSIAYFIGRFSKQLETNSADIVELKLDVKKHGDRIADHDSRLSVLEAHRPTRAH